MGRPGLPPPSTSRKRKKSSWVRAAGEAPDADRLVVARHLAAGRLRQARGEDAERAEHQEEAHAGRLAEGRRDQRALGREDDLDDVEHAFVRIDLGGALGRGGERAERRREPLAEVAALGLVERPVDRALGFGVGAVEVEDDLLRRLGHGQTERVQARLVDAVGLDIVLEVINAVLDLRQDLAAEDLGGVLEDLVEGGFERVDAVALGERDDAAVAEAGGADLGVHVAGEMLGQARIARDDAEGGLVELAALVELDRRDEHTLHPAIGGVDGQAAGHRAADIVVMAEDLAEADQPLAVEDRHRGAEVGDMADAAAGIVGIVPEEDVARLDVVAEILRRPARRSPNRSAR